MTKNRRTFQKDRESVTILEVSANDVTKFCYDLPTVNTLGHNTGALL